MTWGNVMLSNLNHDFNSYQPHKSIIMKKKQLIILSFAVMSLISFNSCKKEGCTDSIADNYNSDADKDDGSCSYSAKVNFWYNGTTSQNLQDDVITSLTFYIDNEVIGSYASSVFFTTSPECGQSSVVSKTLNLGSLKSKTANYFVKDDLGDEVWAGTVTFDASVECTNYELVY